MKKKSLLTSLKELMKPSILQAPTEIIWEVTPKCNKNCKYCGSKKLTRYEALSHESLIKIATNIALSKYKPQEITLTGGEPGTLPYETLYDIVTILRKNKIKIKAVTNGALIDVIADNNQLLFDSFEAIGLSINTLEDIKENKLIKSINSLDNITIITNFGTHNIFLFDKIKEFADKFGAWQVQLTQGNEYQLPKDGIDLLWSKFKNSDIKLGNKMILADNAQPFHVCMAGVYGCSITFHGDVIPCLSVRTWGNSGLKTYGNLICYDFDNIWEKNLEEFRISTCKRSCRDSIDYPNELNNSLNPNEKSKDDFNPGVSTISMYAVVNPKGLPGNLIVYGVFSDGSWTGSKPND